MEIDMAKEKKRRAYSEEFKSNAVKMTLKPGVSVGEVAAQLDIPPTYLSKWRSEMQEQQGMVAAEARVDAISENRRLKDENKRLKMELEILKKATAYFASQK